MRAIKEGDLEIKYDTPFIFAEVNADVVHWIIQKDGRRKKVFNPELNLLLGLNKLKKNYKICFHWDRSQRTKGAWEETSAPKVFMAMAERMLPAITNTQKVRRKNSH